MLNQIKVSPRVVEVFGGREAVRDRAREAGRVLDQAGFPPRQVAQMIQDLLEQEAGDIQDQMNLLALKGLGDQIGQVARG